MPRFVFGLILAVCCFGSFLAGMAYQGDANIAEIEARKTDLYDIEREHANRLFKLRQDEFALDMELQTKQFKLDLNDRSLDIQGWSIEVRDRLLEMQASMLESSRENLQALREFRNEIEERRKQDAARQAEIDAAQKKQE